MNSEADNAAGLPFVRPIVRQITEDLFREQSQWKTGDLVNRIVQLHQARGGSGRSNPAFMVRRVLQDLRDEGLLIAPGHGWWRWTDSTIQEATITEELLTDETASVDDVAEVFEPSIHVEREIGTGSQCIYLYYNPNDRRLAELESREVWECKIGRTSACDAIIRILGQGVKTALSRLPNVGLVIRTDDAAALETALHASLRIVSAEVPDSPGNEWFVTSPARISKHGTRTSKKVSKILGFPLAIPANKVQ